MKSIHLLLPLPVNRANTRMHWATERKYRTQYFDTCDLLCAKYVNNLSLMPDWDRTLLTATFHLWSIMDEDNLVARLKWPIDWLTERAFIVDDAPEYLKLAGIPMQKIDRKYQRLEIILSPYGESEA